MRSQKLKVTGVVFLLGSLFPAVGHSDVGEKSGFFVVKLSGDTLWGDSKEGGFFKRRLFIGSDTLKLDEIIAMKNSRGYYKLTPPDASVHALAHKVRSGQGVDKFQYVDQGGMYGLSGVYNFYSVNDGGLNSINHENIRRDFWSDEKSRELIRNYEFEDKYQSYLIWGGLAATMAGVLIAEGAKIEIVGIPLAFAGSISLFTGYGFWLVKASNLEDVINRHVGEGEN